MKDNYNIGDKMDIKKTLELYNYYRHELKRKGQKVQESKGVKRKNLRIDYFNIVYQLKAIEMEIKQEQLNQEKELEELRFITM
jgi:hypothetical protein